MRSSRASEFLAYAVVVAVAALGLGLSCAAPANCWRVASVDTWASGDVGKAEGEDRWFKSQNVSAGVNLRWDASICDWEVEEEYERPGDEVPGPGGL